MSGNQLWSRLRRVSPLAYMFLSMSVVGVLVELSYHFLPPATIPPYNAWLIGFSAVDRDFFFLCYELIAHIFIAVGLMGLVSIYIYQQMSDSAPKKS